MYPFLHGHQKYSWLLLTLIMSGALYAYGGKGVTLALEREIFQNTISLTVIPPTATVPPGGRLQIEPVVTGLDETSLLWRVIEGKKGGSVDGKGLYTASHKPGIYHVKAVSKGNKKVSAVTTILVTSPQGFTAEMDHQETCRMDSDHSPPHRVRALHLVARKLQVGEIRTLILEASKECFNTLILQLADGVKLSSMEGMVREDAWSIEEFLNVIHFAHNNGLEVIPEIKLLTHQEKLSKDTRPNLMFNTRTYDPRKEETYQVILPILDEIIDLIHPKAVHIGHDEVTRGSQLQSGEDPLPPEFFLMDVERIYGHLAKRGVETWMWGDMLIASEEFHGMSDNYLNRDSGYGALRGTIPKDIVICDWHYFDAQPDFPSAKAFADAGHRVLGATWKNVQTTRNFSSYVAGMPSGGMGMIATTWFHVQRKEWNIVDDIIKTSGEAFLNAR